jgi:hypothetical protein
MSTAVETWKNIREPACGDLMHDNTSVCCDPARNEPHHCSSDMTSPQWRQLYEIADDVILPALGSPVLNHALEKLLELVGEIADNAEEAGRQQRTGLAVIRKLSGASVEL